MTQHHSAVQALRNRLIVLEVLVVLLGLVVAGLPECRAQASYSGGLRVRHQSPPAIPAAQPQAPQPVIPKTPLSYFPDNDFANASYYPGGEPQPQASPAVQLLSLVAPWDLPWNQPGFEDYNVPPQIPRDSSLGQPKRYSLQATPLSAAPAVERPETAGLIAHLPEHAVFWVEGTRTRSIGRTRYFQSPPGRKYNYRVSVAWIEDGSWVSQTRVVPVQAGLIQAIYLRTATPPPEKAAMKTLP
jgi:uncharacterized protein (TIGR03000 family)